jgi:hypothetical protein
VHYHFVRERVLSSEVELQHVPMDRQIADIFTKPLGLDKLRKFSSVLGLRHLDVPNLRGRGEPKGEPKPNELETANSNSENRSERAESDSENRSERAESDCENRLETAESDRGVDSDMLNQPRPKRTRRTQRKH